MWNKIRIYVLALVTGYLNFAFFEVISATPSEVSKEFIDSVSVDRSTEIHLNSQKGNLSIHSWNKPMVWVKVSISFENQNLDIARKEMGYAKFNSYETASEVNFSNYFSLPTGINKIESRVNIDYQVFVPEYVTLIVNNEYGNCLLNNLNGYMNINNKYGDIVLNDVRGFINVFANLCDVSMNDFSGSLKLFSVNSDATLINLNGKATIDTRNGSLRIEQGELLNQLMVTSTYSEVDVLISDLHRFNYDITSRHAKITLGEKYRRFPFKHKSKEKLVFRTEKSNRIIDITANYNTIKLH